MAPCFQYDALLRVYPPRPIASTSQLHASLAGNSMVSNWQADGGRSGSCAYMPHCGWLSAWTYMSQHSRQSDEGRPGYWSYMPHCGWLSTWAYMSQLSYQRL